MSWLIYTVIFVISAYILTIISFSVGWFRLNAFKTTDKKINLPISIIIACRNEEEKIASLLDAMAKQNYAKNIMEVIVIDDHSEDRTPKIIAQYTENFDFIKLFQLPGNKSGKKQAIAHGIEKSSTNIIVTTDADCEMKENWLTSLVSYYMKEKPLLISGPVIIKNSKNIFQNLQSLEFLSLVGSGAGAMGIHKAIMNNGANLLFEKSLFSNANTFLDLPSGDDIFLMLHAKKIDKKAVHFIKSRDAVVYTEGVKTISSFIHQRIRWTSKSKAYKDFDVIFTALIVSVTNLLLLFCLVTVFWNYSFLTLFLILFLLKSAADLSILIPTSFYFKKQNLLWFFFPLQVIYPFYLILTVLLGLTGNFQWKNRSFKEKR